MIDITQCKQFALIQLKKRWSVPIAITIIFVIISFLFSIPNFYQVELQQLTDLINQQKFDEINEMIANISKGTIGLTLMTILQGLVLSVIRIAADKTYLFMSKNKDKVSLAKFVENLTYFGRGLLSCIVKSFWLILWGLIPFTFFAIGSLFLNLSQLKTTLLGTNISSFSIILYLIFMILFLGSILILVIKYYSYSQMYFLVAEFDNMKMSKAMEISKIITQNHKTELFILDLSFIAWYIISFFTFGISVLFSKPYINMSKINAYHSLLKEAIDTKKILPEDLQ